MMRPPSATLTSIVLLAAWLGAAILVAGVVAPAAFAVLPSRGVAGELIGRVLPPLFWSGMAVGLVVVALGQRMPDSAWRTGSALVLAAACAVAQLVIAPRIHAIRTQIAGSIDSIEGTDPRRIAFGQLHGLSVATMGLGAIAAAVTMGIVLHHLANRDLP